ncbi:hypothetical protein B0T10DRAFT_478952 [Thelonectria olida]|uniref:Required for respiratory growth protein 7, mitochondrial n=1 Tax=Thelonectria olida TaxID=1576542 RepID=A0A9P9AU23_9HYPO|nr:hypothetical protein B0T10DRAFT_478952 [Thelonectria olida]
MLGPRHGRLGGVAARQLSRIRRGAPATTTARRFLSDKTDDNANSRATAAAAAELIYPDAAKEHSDLASFLAYVKRTKLGKTTPFYRGTHYEYTVARALSAYGFALRRVGGTSDRGLDLLGTWKIPGTRRTTRVALQCKSGARVAGPQYARELKGAMAEAPPGWRGDGEALGLLVAEKPATRGVLEELRAPVGLGYVCCSRDGEVVQLLWNQRAQEMGLEGVTVGVKYVDDAAGKKKLVLMRRGKVLPMLDVAE